MPTIDSQVTDGVKLLPNDVNIVSLLSQMIFLV